MKAIFTRNNDFKVVNDLGETKPYTALLNSDYDYVICDNNEVYRKEYEVEIDNGEYDELWNSYETHVEALHELIDLYYDDSKTFNKVYIDCVITLATPESDSFDIEDLDFWDGVDGKTMEVWDR